MAALRRRQPVHASLDAFCQQHGGERVEVVLVCQQEHGRDSLEPRAAAGGRREQLTRGQFQPRLPDLIPLLIQARPHEHLQARGPQRPPETDDPRHRRRPAAAGCGPGRVTRSRRAAGIAVRPYKVTVATITTNVTGRILAAPPMPLATRPAANVDAVAAATMPRGAIQPMNARSPFPRSVPIVAANAAIGLAARTRTATKASVGSSRCRSECGVTVAEMEMNRMPIISCTSVSKNGRRAGMSKPRRLARASPMKIAAISPVSSRSDVARGGHGDHRGELRGGAEHLAEPELAEQQPEQRGADHPAGQADARR